MEKRLLMSKTTIVPGGVWSAAPTPFTASMQIDTDAIARMVEHHARLGVQGFFLAGTNGEGPWMPDAQRDLLVRTVVDCVNGRYPVAVQVTDNSSARILANMHSAKACGADIAIIAPPYFFFNPTPKNIVSLYLDAIHESPLPVGIYDRGKNGSVVVPNEAIKAIYADKHVIMIKDSSADMDRMQIALAAKKKRPGLCLLNGWEFNCVEYLTAGYDGLLLGGGVFNGFLANQIMAAVAAGKVAKANKIQQRMNRIMYDVYGGKKIACWLAGEKKLLVDMGIFCTWKNYPNYPLTKSCANAITRVLEKDADALLP